MYRLVLGAIAAIAMASIASPACAQEFELRADDLRVVGDARWTGGGWGGYHPVRLEITNFGTGRDLEIRFEPHDRGEGTPTVRRRVRVEQNATARLTLSVPLVGGNSGRLEFVVAGVPIEGLRRDLSLMPSDGGSAPAPSLLVISPNGVDLNGFQQAAMSAAQEWNATGVPSSHVLAGGAGGDVRTAVIPPSLLPASWLDYSAVDLIAIRPETLNSLRPDDRAALTAWVATGGRLIVHGLGPSPETSEQIGRLFAPPADGQEWRLADPAERQAINLIAPAGPGGATPNEGMPFPPGIPGPAGIAGGAGIPGGMPAELIAPLMEQFGAPQGFTQVQHHWPSASNVFAVRDVGFGQIAAVSEDVFTGGAADWAWLLRAMNGPTTAWPIRHGLASGHGDIEFINLPIRGVRGVPAGAFLSLITLFALVIGPVNYFVLWRKGRLSRLVLTVPALAAVTSVLLFGYAALAQGFSTKGRVRSVTLIDPAEKSATTVARTAVFSGLAPSRGLVFSNDTAVYPLLPYGEQFSDGEVDWTDAQGLTAGWLKTRTRTQFVTMTHRDERGRLTVTPTSDGMRVVNGFDVPLRFLAVTGPDGAPYFGRALAAGGEAVLKPLTEQDWTEIREYAVERLPEPPDGVEANDIMSGFGGRPWMWFQRSWQPQFRYGLLERHLARLGGQAPAAQEAGASPAPTVAGDDRIDRAVAEGIVDPLTSPRGFLAVADGNPGVDLGGLDVDERDSVHMLMGRW